MLTLRLAAALIAAASALPAQVYGSPASERINDLASVAGQSRHADSNEEKAPDIRSRAVPSAGTALNSLCDQEAPRLEIFESHWAHWGAVDEAFGLFARREAVERGTCTCPRGAVTFEEFTVHVVGKAPSELDPSDVIPLRRFAQGAGRGARAIYADFRAASCEED